MRDKETTFCCSMIVGAENVTMQIPWQWLVPSVMWRCTFLSQTPVYANGQLDAQEQDNTSKASLKYCKRCAPKFEQFCKSMTG